ncbi:MAG TPA: DUF2939 domain-containing protein [Caulobacteraceae bacterium]|jgi:hypothetical protein|nr:DUF2939 domain-containing protein [Caulobacteraceae bacterium]
MTPIWKPIAAAAALTALAACATTQRIDAAGDVHALLIAIRDDDHAAFDAHVDRQALEQELETRILDRTQARGTNDVVQALGAALAQPFSHLAGEALIRPQVFRAVAEFYGYRPQTAIPNQLEIAGALKALPDGRVCAAKKRQGPCLITFANEAGVWRLVSFDGDVSLLRLPS